MDALRGVLNKLNWLMSKLGAPVAGTLATTVEAVATAVGLIPTTDHFVLIPTEAAPHAVSAAGGGTDTYYIAIPVGAKSFAVGSINAARTGGLAGYAAASDNPRTKSGPATASLNDAAFIPAQCDDFDGPPTHIFVANTDSVSGYVWVQFYK